MICPEVLQLLAAANEELLDFAYVAVPEESLERIVDPQNAKGIVEPLGQDFGVDFAGRQGARLVAVEGAHGRAVFVVVKLHRIIQN